MKTNKALYVKYHDRPVGILADIDNGKIAFEYLLNN